MNRETGLVADGPARLKVENYLDADGNIAIPAGVTLTSFLDRNIEELGDTPAYRYLDFDRDRTIELSWAEMGVRLRAVGARLRQVTHAGDRVAILTPQGVDYVVGFFAAIQAGAIAVPLFAPELPGHNERLEAVLADARPTVVLTTTAAAKSVGSFLRTLPRDRRPRMIAIDAVPDAVGNDFVPAPLQTDAHRLPAVHIRVDPRACRRRDHSPVGVYQCRADDPVRRPGPEHPQRQLVAAVP